MLNYKMLCDNNEIIAYKNKIKSILISSKELHELVTNSEIDADSDESIAEYGETLNGVNYIPQLFVDGTVTSAQAYVLYDANQYSVHGIETGRSTYNKYKVYFHILCHKGIYMVDGFGTRCDCIVAVLCDLLKDKILYSDGALGIGANKKVSDIIGDSPNNDYVMRELQFICTDFDERVKMNGKY